jgi:hypothetical protein
MTQRLLVFLAGLALTSAPAGCGGSAGAPVAQAYPAHGKITFPDNTPLRGGIITFTPTEVRAGRELRYEGAGLIDAKGDYKVGFNGNDAGVPAGEYKVTIRPRDYQELRNSNSGRIPEAYRDLSTTPLTVTVKEEPNAFNFVLK